MYIEKTQKLVQHIEEEIWKDICGYEGLYQISNKGKIKIIKDGNIKILEKKGKRVSVYIVKNNITKKVPVCRLVANHFIPNPDNLKNVGFYDGDMTNNDASNLFWTNGRIKGLKHSKSKNRKDRIWSEIQNLKGEIWKDIKNYEGLYKVSNFGRVRGKRNFIQHKIRRNTSVTVQLNDEFNSQKTFTLKDIVAREFVENPFNYTLVYHIDGNFKNNNSTNLMWKNKLSRRKNSNETFIERMVEKYGKDTLDFSKTDYSYIRRKTTVRCIKHDIEITIWPQFMLRKKHFCDECLKEHYIEKINRILESHNSPWRLKYDGFKKVTSKANFYNLITGEEKVMIPAEFSNRTATNQKESNRFLQSRKFELDKIISSIPKNFSINHNLAETKNLTITCNIHNKSKFINLKFFIKYGKSLLDKCCPDCQTEKIIEKRNQKISEKNKKIAEKDIQNRLKIKKCFTIEKFSEFDFSESIISIKGRKYYIENIICKTHQKEDPFQIEAYRIIKGFNIGCNQCKNSTPFERFNKFMEIDSRYSFNEDCFNYYGKRLDVVCSKHGKFIISRDTINRILRNYSKTGKIKPICKSCFIESKSIQNTLPELLEDWDFEKNDFLPSHITKGSEKRVHWKCKRCKKPFTCKVSEKLRLMNGCPHCSIKTSSKIERIIFYFVECIFGQVSHNDTYRYGKGKHEKFSYDMMVSSLNPPLVLEYDGSHWHKEKYEFDRSKTRKIIKQGFKCLRIRENPLKKIQKHDIQFEFTDYNNHEFSERLKGLIVEILDWLIANYDINASIQKKIYEVISESKFDLDSIPKDFFFFPLLGKSAEDEFPELLDHWDSELNGLTLKQISKSSMTRYLWWCKCGNNYEMTLKIKLSIINNPEMELDGHCSQCKEIKFTEKKEYTINAIDKLRLLLPSEYSSLSLVDIMKIKRIDFKCERCGNEDNKSLGRTLRMISDYGKVVCGTCKMHEEYQLLLNK